MRGKSIYLTGEEIRLLQTCIEKECQRYGDNFNSEEESKLFEKTLESLTKKIRTNPKTIELTRF